jgi:hypothetical protein
MIYNPFASIPVRPKSHVRGWAMHWSECLNVPVAGPTDPLTCPTLYIEHGVNFGGVLNLFGGVSEGLVDRLEELANYKGQLVSLDWPMPNYVHQLSRRLGQATCSTRLTPALLANLDARLKNSTTLTQRDLKSDVVAIGDSHSTAFAASGSGVIRINGLTLHGALQKGHFVEQIGRLVHKPRRVTLVCGSIDIRHHIGRQSNPKQAVIDLCNSYADVADFLADEFNLQVEIAAPVPIEWEKRKIPQTGFYKGTPFTGTVDQRRYWTELFMDTLSQQCLISPPSSWYSVDPEEYANIFMELNSSVHIAPPFYRRFDWGQL